MGIATTETPLPELPGTTADIAPIDVIRVGERDRSDLGDIAELAASIAAVGLLHPIVITADNDLVAGGRRLAAIRSLGWTETPVTVVDWSTAELALRAEEEENTCRKGLSPVEAARARQRRLRALDAAGALRKQGRPAAQPGAPAAIPGQGALLPGSEVEAKPAKLAGFSTPPAGDRRRVGATGSGYSHTSIDKVDEVIQIAETGTRPVGVGKLRHDEPVPEPVREVARQQLPALAKTGAAIQPAHQAVRKALDEHLGKDPEVQLALVLKNYASAAVGLRNFTILDPIRVAEALNSQRDGSERWADIDRLRAAVDDWFDRIDTARPKPGLRLAGGNQ